MDLNPNNPLNTVVYNLYHQNFNKRKEKLIEIYLDYLKQFYKNDYIWHNDPFQLELSSNDENYIHGQCNYGENIEDEWFIIFLLKQLTIFDSDLIIQVKDEDGEILLIECAMFLKEKWMQCPKQTENRVYIFRGDIHLVSPKFLKNDKSLSKRSFIKNCLDFIYKNPEKTRCDDGIQNCINKRLEDYPENIEKWHHHSYCYLPIRLATILQHQPNLISNSVRRFYYRTPDDLKSKKVYFNVTEKWIIYRVRFNRCLYAQLMSQDFGQVPNRFKDIIPSKTSKDYKTYSNGIKIVAGFEMLLNDYETGSGSNIGEQIRRCLENLNQDEIIELEKQKLLPEDDDNWLEINQEQLDTLLNEKFNIKNDEKNDKNFTESIPNTLFEFFKNERSGLNGIENDSDEDSSIIEDSSDSDEEDEEIELQELKDYMKQMDSELSQTILAKSFDRKPQESGVLDSDDDSEEEEEKNIKFNAMSNIIKSVQEEQQTTEILAGPATTLFAFMKQKVPDLRGKNK